MGRLLPQLRVVVSYYGKRWYGEPSVKLKRNSKVPAGTTMGDIAVFHNEREIKAKEDSEYPDWLWKMVDTADTSFDLPKKRNVFSAFDKDVILERRKARLRENSIEMRSKRF